MPKRAPDLKALVAALNRDRVQYVLIGGMAMILHGGTHVTLDCDLAVASSRSNIAAIVRALRRFSPVPVGFELGDAFEWDETALASPAVHLETLAGEVDLLFETPGVDSFAELLKRSEERRVASIEVRVACLDDLIAMKAAANRDKDKLHLIELREIRRLTDHRRE